MIIYVIPYNPTVVDKSEGFIYNIIYKYNIIHTILYNIIYNIRVRVL